MRLDTRIKKIAVVCVGCGVEWLIHISRKQPICYRCGKRGIPKKNDKNSKT